MRIRAARRADDAAVDEIVVRAFGDEDPTIARLLGLLAAAGHRVAALVAEGDGRVLGHVQLSRSWVDARERLVDVLVPFWATDAVGLRDPLLAQWGRDPV